MENQQITSNKTIQSLKVCSVMIFSAQARLVVFCEQAQIDELVKKNGTMNEQYDEQNQLLAKITSG